MSADWTEGVERRVEEAAARYPRPESALLPALRIVQEIFGCVPVDAEARIAAILGMPAVRVREAATFYGYFSREPLGRHRIQVCRNLSCTLRGGARVLDYLRERLGLEPGQTAADGSITLEAVECLGRCDEAPCLSVDDRIYGKLTEEEIDRILGELGTD